MEWKESNVDLGRAGSWSPAEEEEDAGATSVLRRVGTLHSALSNAVERCLRRSLPGAMGQSAASTWPGDRIAQLELRVLMDARDALEELEAQLEEVQMCPAAQQDNALRRLEERRRHLALCLLRHPLLTGQQHTGEPSAPGAITELEVVLELLAFVGESVPRSAGLDFARQSTVDSPRGMVSASGGRTPFGIPAAPPSRVHHGLKHEQEQEQEQALAGQAQAGKQLLWLQPDHAPLALSQETTTLFLDQASSSSSVMAVADAKGSQRRRRAEEESESWGTVEWTSGPGMAAPALQCCSSSSSTEHDGESRKPVGSAFTPFKAQAQAPPAAEPRPENRPTQDPLGATSKRASESRGRTKRNSRGKAPSTASSAASSPGSGPVAIAAAAAPAADASSARGSPTSRNPKRSPLTPSCGDQETIEGVTSALVVHQGLPAVPLQQAQGGQQQQQQAKPQQEQQQKKLTYGGPPLLVAFLLGSGRAAASGVYTVGRASVGLVCCAARVAAQAVSSTGALLLQPRRVLGCSLLLLGAAAPLRLYSVLSLPAPLRAPAGRRVRRGREESAGKRRAYKAAAAVSMSLEAPWGSNSGLDSAQSSGGEGSTLTSGASAEESFTSPTWAGSLPPPESAACGLARGASSCEFPAPGPQVVVAHSISTLMAGSRPPPADLAPEFPPKSATLRAAAGQYDSPTAAGGAFSRGSSSASGQDKGGRVRSASVYCSEAKAARGSVGAEPVHACVIIRRVGSDHPDVFAGRG